VEYIYYVIVFSRNKEYHIAHLSRVFNRCRRYGTSLNPKKIVFTVDEGRLLGFIVSKHGMKIEPKRNETFSKIPPPHKKKYMHSFLGRIKFVRIFIPSFVETLKPL
jgi:hypothetical protein